MNYVSIKNWASDDQPREKLSRHGAGVLSDAELLAILIGTGTRELSAVELSRKVLALSQNNLAELGRLSYNDFKKVKGIGEAKAITIAAALELGRRRNATELPDKFLLSSSKAAAGLFLPILSDLPHEEFWVAYLTRSNKLIEKSKISSGGVSGTVIDIKMLMKKAAELLCSGIIICHNHPSGNMQYSQQDLQITNKIKEAGKIFDINLLDHIIVAGNNYYSFADEGLI